MFNVYRFDADTGRWTAEGKSHASYASACRYAAQLEARTIRTTVRRVPA